MLLSNQQNQQQKQFIYSYTAPDFQGVCSCVSLYQMLLNKDNNYANNSIILKRRQRSLTYVLEMKKALKFMGKTNIF